SETMHWYYESQETAGKITEITDETRHGSKVTKFKLQTPEGEAAIEYPKEFSLTEGNNLLNQDVEYRRIEERYEESFRFGGGTSLTTNYQMRILSGTFKGMSLKARTTS
ncbi:MAG TPA: hypothetical protein VJK03_01565, partial [Candidatus Nanoarchaeia archaeon]|nr:hypothetical protein [Candidatus Nanoarchaeia archaeon]